MSAERAQQSGENGARRWTHQPCVRTEPHPGHTHINEGPRGGCGLPEWCPGVRATPPASTASRRPGFDFRGRPIPPTGAVVRNAWTAGA